MLMPIKHIFSALSLIILGQTINANSLQTIDILNNSAQALHITAKNGDCSMSFNQTIPVYAKLFVMVQVTKLELLQDMLYIGIINDSPERIMQAIASGANVNLEKGGIRPLSWAMKLGKNNAALCLLEHGAI